MSVKTQCHLISTNQQPFACLYWCKTEVSASSALVSEGLAQGPYVVVRAGFKPATLVTQDMELTTEPPCPTVLHIHEYLNTYKKYYK